MIAINNNYIYLPSHKFDFAPNAFGLTPYNTKHIIDAIHNNIENG